MSRTPRPAAGDPADQPIDPWLVERLTADPATARDHDEQALATLFAALRGPATEAELDRHQDYLATFAAAQSTPTRSSIAPNESAPPQFGQPRMRRGNPIPPRRASMLHALLTAKTVVAAAALATATATAAAAYTGTLPDALQDAAHRAIGAPAASTTADSTKEATNHALTASQGKSSATASATGQGPDATGPAAYGLCNAYTHGGLASTSAAYRNLATAAGGPEQITTYCSIIPRPGTSAATTAGKTKQSSEHPTGKPSEHPTGKPSSAPTGVPSEHPTGKPTGPPTP